MSTKTISCFLLILCSVLLVQVKSQICQGIAQYAKCSPNTGCGCLHIPGAINVGILTNITTTTTVPTTTTTCAQQL
ncbi:unnamed protein product, partial [Rotaria magnacalcarata]